MEFIEKLQYYSAKDNNIAEWILQRQNKICIYGFHFHLYINSENFLHNL
jgi:hypothetical protein